VFPETAPCWGNDWETAQIAGGIAEVPIAAGLQLNVSAKVRIVPLISGRFLRYSDLRPDSAKRSGNPARRTAYRNMDDFPVPLAAALIGPSSEFREKV